MYAKCRKYRLLVSLMMLVLILGPIEISADPFFPDSVKIDSITVALGESIALDIHTFTDEWLTGIEITIGWDYNPLHIDSFVFNPNRFGSTIFKGYTTHLSILTVFAFPMQDQLITPDNARIGSMYMSQPDSTVPGLVIFDTTTIIIPDSIANVERSTVFTDTLSAEPFIPHFIRGLVYINDCCGAFTGNTDCDSEAKRNLADITRLIDRVYVTKIPLCCKASGNTNGDPEGKVNLADITKLIDHVYISKDETAPCP